MKKLVINKYGFLGYSEDEEAPKGPKNETLAEHMEHCKAKQGNCPFEKKASNEALEQDVVSGSGNNHVDVSSNSGLVGKASILNDAGLSDDDAAGWKKHAYELNAFQKQERQSVPFGGEHDNALLALSQAGKDVYLNPGSRDNIEKLKKAKASLAKFYGVKNT